ncbi:MAG: M14 family zinc carboxypeptidase [Bacteroidetes bacterium]|nr:M14 family zinc carboxypeptidase [Bacteroidota bacterium]
MRLFRVLASLLVGIVLISTTSTAQVPHPKEVFGFMPGDDYKLARFDQLISYYKTLANTSDRVVYQEIGASVDGLPMPLVMISSEENLNSLEQWKSISSSLARARISESQAEMHSQEGRAIIWIDAGLHSNEVSGAQMAPLLAWRVATEASSEMDHIRENVILLLMPIMNPDGHDIIASWYDHTVGTPYEASSPPWLYHHYAGHDNNRDWFMNNLPESKAVSEILYNQWYPQIVVNHHQVSPNWTRIFIPPFTDPVNPRIHPGITTGVNLVGSAMANRFAMKEMPGVISGVTFSMWWNGGMRTVPYYHNMIGILTEAAHATPSPRFFDPDSIPDFVRGGHPTNGTNINYPNPWKGGWSHFSEPVQYMITASMAVLRLAADRRQTLLYNIWKMGQDAIHAEDSVAAYVLPAEQWNAGEEIELVNILRVGGIEIEQATASFLVDGSQYEAGSFIIPTAQPFRAYLKDLLEPQHYPDRKTQAGDPIVPYDLAGWTLPYQMGVRVDRVSVLPNVATVPVTESVHPLPGQMPADNASRVVMDPRPNQSRHVINQAMRDGLAVEVIPEPIQVGENSWPSGALVIESDPSLRRIADFTGTNFYEVPQDAPADLVKLDAPKIGLYKSWVANMDEGWTRMVLESYAFDMDTLHDSDIRDRDLSSYTAILLPSQTPERLLHGHRKGMMPEIYTGGLGLEGTLALNEYVTEGGILVALDAASDYVIDQFGLPIENVVEGVSASEFFIPGSIVQLHIDHAHPIGYGLPSQTAASFVRSRAFLTVRRSNLQEGGRIELYQADPLPVEVIARYAEEDILMSGWALGEDQYLSGKAAVVRVSHGEGAIVLFGFRPQFRGQTRGTYKLLFNALMMGNIDGS